ncbi:MAG: hypothetical protein GY803_19980 [Chloroflexi bacterium]|nr:hypothetical protein [Chloroflexota bacterium]
MIRKLIGILIILISLIGVALSIGGTMKVPDILDAIAAGLDSTLSLTVESLDTVQDSLVLAKATVDEANKGLDSVTVLAADLGTTIEETRPLLDEITAVTSDDIPDSIETMQAAIPNMAEAAAVIDSTLVTLSRFRIDEKILGIELKYDLGIDYDPSVPFDETVYDLGSSMDGLPERLESLATELAVADENLAVISEDMDSIAGDLEGINEQIAEIPTLLDEYVGIVTELSDAIRQSRSQTQTYFDAIKLGVTIILVWLGLMQLAPLYLGLELLTGRRENNNE